MSLASPDFVAHSTGEKPQAPERPCPQQRGQGRSGELVHFSQRSPDLLDHLLHLPRSDAAHGSLRRHLQGRHVTDTERSNGGFPLLGSRRRAHDGTARQPLPPVESLLSAFHGLMFQPV